MFLLLAAGRCRRWESTRAPAAPAGGAARAFPYEGSSGRGKRLLVPQPDAPAGAVRPYRPFPVAIARGWAAAGGGSADPGAERQTRWSRVSRGRKARVAMARAGGGMAPTFWALRCCSCRLFQVQQVGAGRAGPGSGLRAGTDPPLRPPRPSGAGSGAAACAASGRRCRR